MSQNPLFQSISSSLSNQAQQSPQSALGQVYSIIGGILGQLGHPLAGHFSQLGQIVGGMGAITPFNPIGAVQAGIKAQQNFNDPTNTSGNYSIPQTLMNEMVGLPLSVIEGGLGKGLENGMPFGRSMEKTMQPLPQPNFQYAQPISGGAGSPQPAPQQ